MAGSSTRVKKVPISIPTTRIKSALIEGENWVLIPNAYFNKIDDYIIGMPSTNSSANMIAMMMRAQVPLVWSNQDAEIAGFDLVYTHRLSENLDVNLLGQYVRGKQPGEVGRRR